MTSWEIELATIANNESRFDGFTLLDSVRSVGVRIRVTYLAALN
jgi:hypothetical protein